MSKQGDFYKTGPITDPAPVLAKVREIVADAKSLTDFEAKFLKEVAHAAHRFDTAFRISPKQLKVLDELWDKHCLPTVIDAKTKKGT